MSKTEDLRRKPLGAATEERALATELAAEVDLLRQRLATVYEDMWQRDARAFVCALIARGSDLRSVAQEAAIVADEMREYRAGRLKG